MTTYPLGQNPAPAIAAATLLLLFPVASGALLDLDLQIKSGECAVDTGSFSLSTPLVKADCLGDLPLAGVASVPLDAALPALADSNEDCEGYQLIYGDDSYRKVWIWDDDAVDSPVNTGTPPPECRLHLPDEVSFDEYHSGVTPFIVAYYCPTEERQQDNPCDETSGSVHVYHIMSWGGSTTTSSFYAEFAAVYEDGRRHECTETHRNVCWFLGTQRNGPSSPVVEVGANRWYFNHQDIGSIRGEGGFGGGVWYGPMD